MNKYVRPARPEDVVKIVPLLRPEDVRECTDMTGKEPLKVLLTGLLVSDISYTLRDEEGELAGILGVTPLGGYEGVGCVWLMGTELITRRPVTFIRQSKLWLEELHRHFPTLINVADARNEAHVKWLRYLGFSLIRKIENYGPGKIEVIEFARIRKDV